MTPSYLLCGMLVLASAECTVHVHNDNHCDDDHDHDHDSHDDGTCDDDDDDDRMLVDGFAPFEGAPLASGLAISADRIVLVLAGETVPLHGTLDQDGAALAGSGASVEARREQQGFVGTVRIGRRRLPVRFALDERAHDRLPLTPE